MTDVIANAYATMADFRLYVRDSATSDADDSDTALKLLALEASARAIDTACNRTFAVAPDTAVARYFTPRAESSPYGWSRVICEIADLFDTTGMEVTADATGNGDFGDPITTYRVWPYDAADRGKPYTALVFDYGSAIQLDNDRVKVSALFGWDAIPTTIVQANLLQAARFYKRRDAAFGIAGSPDLGNEIRLLAKLDPDVAVMVNPFKRYF